MINRSRSALHHFGRYFRFFGAYSAIFAALLAFFVFLPSIAEATTNREPVVHKISFNDIDGDPVRTLDWRSPSTSLTFDVPDNDWVDEVEFLLSAHPVGAVAPSAPLLVRFNGAAPVPVHSEGYGFDARLRLDRLKLQKDRNQISIEYQVPAGQACLGAQHGAWNINADASLMVVTSRPKSRAPHFHDLKTRLAAKATAPQTVALTAFGPQALKLKALAAQGMAQNVKDIPNFRNFSKHAKVEVILGLRRQLPKRAKNDDLRNGTGPLIAVGSSQPLQIIVTGDTPDELMRAAKAFAAYPIPVSYNRELSPTRFMHTAPQIGRVKRAKGKMLLSDLGSHQFTSGWAPRPQHIYFDVEDPAASFGTVSLALRAGAIVDPGSKLTASLNGHIIGDVQINKPRTRANLDIPRGVLQGLNNRLTLTPDLSPAQRTCAASRMGPGFTLDPKSSLKIKTAQTSDLTDLSRFSASGLPFAAQQGAKTHVIIATKNTSETYAALKVVAQLGRASRTGWGDARFTNGLENFTPDAASNVLVIGSHIDTTMALFSSAPKGLKVAMGGALKRMPVTTLSAQNTVGLPALLSTISPVEGGVAALYRDAKDPNRIIGVITQTKGHPFTRAVDDLLRNDHWNALEGSVSRWDRKRIIMAQTAMPAAQRAKDFKFALGAETMSLPSMPTLSLPKMKMPDIGPLAAALQNKWTALKESAASLLARKPNEAPTPAQESNNSPNIAGTYTPLRAAVRQETTFLPVSPQIVRNSAKTAANVPQVRMPQSLRKPLNRPSETSDWPPVQSAPIETLKMPSPIKAETERQALLQMASLQFAQASERLSTILSTTPLARFGAHDDPSVKFLLFAIIGSIMLLLVAIVSPLKSDARDA